MAKKTSKKAAKATKKETPEQLRKRTLEIIVRLRRQFPDPRTALHYTTPLDLLVATILSAQCTDVRVNLVTPELFKKYTTAADYAAADEAKLQMEIRATGFFRQKAKALIGVGRALQEHCGGKVPAEMDELVKLPSVGRKTANVVLGSAFGKAAGIVVDRHVARVSGRLGLTRQTDPVKIELELMELVPRKDWIDVSHMLVLHGRHTCVARKPRCAACVLNEVCPSAFTFGDEDKKPKA